MKKKIGVRVKFNNKHHFCFQMMSVKFYSDPNFPPNLKKVD